MRIAQACLGLAVFACLQVGCGERPLGAGGRWEVLAIEGVATHQAVARLSTGRVYLVGGRSSGDFVRETSVVDIDGQLQVGHRIPETCRGVRTVVLPNDSVFVACFGAFGTSPSVWFALPPGADRWCRIRSDGSWGSLTRPAPTQRPLYLATGDGMVMLGGYRDGAVYRTDSIPRCEDGSNGFEWRLWPNTRSQGGAVGASAVIAAWKGGVLLVGGFDGKDTVKAVDYLGGESLTPWLHQLRTERVGHTATKVGESVVVVGGARYSGSRFEHVPGVEDIGTGDNSRWTLPPNWSSVSHTATALSADAMLLVGGRTVGGNRRTLDAAYILASSGEYYDVEPVPGPRFGHSAVLLADGSVLVVGGFAYDATGDIHPASPYAVRYVRSPE